MKLSTILIALVVVVVGGLGVYGLVKNNVPESATSPPAESAVQTPQEADKQEAVTKSETKNMTLAKPEMMIDKNKTYKAVLRTTAGDMEIALNAKETPITVNNFVYLARQGFYDGTNFHRVLKGFMIQGGDPQGDGRGGPGYRFNDEPFQGSYSRGTVAMANAGPNTNGSQFFIMHADYPLPPNYVIFGKLLNGLDTLDKIATAPVVASFSGESSKPVTPVVVNKVEIVEE